VDPGVHAEPFHRLRHRLRVADVAFHQRDVTDGGPVPELQGVECHDLPATLAQEADCVRSDIAGSAGHQDCHLESLPDYRLAAETLSPFNRPARLPLSLLVSYGSV